MAVLEIVTPPHPVLRQKARPVTDFGPELQELIENMVTTMHAADGVGLAANQVAVPARVIVVQMPMPEDADPNDENDPLPPHTGELFALINPRISWHSRQTVEGVEGCLSLPGIVGEVERFREVRVNALDRHGVKFGMRFQGWLARIFQHEVDHLDGILFTDHIEDPEKIWPVAVGEEEKAEIEAAQRLPARDLPPSRDAESSRHGRYLP
jgi:peptide deformylase